MPQGYLALVLHAHLPFVRHPEHRTFLEEMWFFEALAETYIPLLKMLDRLENDGVGYHLLLGISPTLTAMMEDELLQERFVRHVGKALRLADREAGRHPEGSDRHRLALYYADHFRDVLYWFEEKCRRRLAPAFAAVADFGNLDLMTCGATHGFLPILQQNRGAVRAQIETARDYHEKTYGRRPQGIWMPECAYCPGLEKALAAAGFAYSFVDAHGIENAESAPRFGVYAPLCSAEGVAFFGRDRDISFQVWSAEQGYPGHPDYREFYRDLGFELPEADLEEFIIDGRVRVNTGLKFNRITSRHGGDKDYYRPDAAREQAARHAAHFLDQCARKVRQVAPAMGGLPPLITAPYDAELFGHWWFEGPWFLDYVFRKMHYDQEVVKALTPAKYLRAYPEQQLARPAGSSWGGDGSYEFWVNEANQDVIPGLHQAADRLSEVVEARDDLEYAAGGEEAEVVKQMFRELLLAQASDWPFIMRAGTSPEYARKRITDHLHRFWALERMLYEGVDSGALDAIRRVDNVFPECNPRLFARD